MVQTGLAAKLVSMLAALGAAAATATGPGAFAQGPALVESGGRCATSSNTVQCANLFDGASQLTPGGPAEVRDVELTYRGQQPSAMAGLYVSNFKTRGPQSSNRYCTASDPASMLEFAVSIAGTVLYRGSLSRFAAEHFDPPSHLSLVGRSGVPDRLTPNERDTVELSIGLSREAGDAYMGCESSVDFVWAAQ